MRKLKKYALKFLQFINRRTFALAGIKMEILSPKFLDNSFGLSHGCPLDRKLINDFISNVISRPGVEPEFILEFDGLIYFEAPDKGRSVSVFFYSEGRPANRTSEREIYGDLCLVPDPSLQESFDLIICTQLLTFVRDDESALKSLLQMLKPGGLIVGTEPFLTPLSIYDDDQWGEWRRYTPRGLESLLRRATGESDVTIQRLGDSRTSAEVIMGGPISLSWDGPQDALTLNGSNSSSSPTALGYVIAKRMEDVA